VNNVVQFPTKGTSIDECMAWLNDLHARGELVELVAIASDKQGHYDVGLSKMSAMHALYMTTYMHEQVMVVLRDGGLMPAHADDT
jgi:hypothetical protein